MSMSIALAPRTRLVATFAGTIALSLASSYSNAVHNAASTLNCPEFEPREYRSREAPRFAADHFHRHLDEALKVEEGW